jgi:hypothetical protein
VIRSRVLTHVGETERPFGCGSDDRSADCDLPPDRRIFVRNLSGPMSLRVTSYRTVAINGWPLACYAYDRSCAVRAEAKLSLADLAGRPCPHRWTRSGLQHPGGPRREIRHRCHLIVTSTRTSTRKMVELRGFEPLTFCMPYKTLLFRNVARCGSTSSFTRCTLLAVAWYRRSFAPRFAPLLALPRISCA